MALGPFGGEGTLPHPTQYSPSYLTHFKSSGLSLEEGGQGKRVNVGSYIDGSVSKAWRFRPIGMLGLPEGPGHYCVF